MTSLQDWHPHAAGDTEPGRAMPAAAGSADVNLGSTAAAPPTNVGEQERTVSLAAGGILIGLGLSRRTAPGLLVAAVGAGLVHRGLTGHCAAYAALGLDTSDR